ITVPPATAANILALPSLMCHILHLCNVHGTPNSPAISDASMVNTTGMIGQDVHFKCSIDHMADKSTLIFLRPGPPQKLISYDNQIFSPLKRKYELNTKGGPFGNQWTLTIKNAQPADRGFYACQLNNKNVSSRTGFLDLKIPPAISQSTPSAVEVREGENVTLGCKADGAPEPTITWRRQDRQIIRVNGQEGFGASVFHGPEMNLTRVSRRHMSEYVCVASNGIGPDESWAIKLLVTFPPHVQAKKRMLAVRRGQVARLACDAWPRPEVTWQHDGNFVHEGNQHNQNYSVTGQLTTAHVLEIRSIMPKNYGVYRCTARNDNGIHHADIELVESEDDARYANRVRPEGNIDDEVSADSEGADDETDADFYQYTTAPVLWERETSTAPPQPQHHPTHHSHRHHEPATVTGRQVEERET
ncbi:hypothetical protein PFISCL1PPCAC_20908, partial [Pristionchus fissidentatus]